MSPWLYNTFTDTVMKEVKVRMGKMGMKFQNKEREWRLTGLLYTDDLVLYGESEDLKVLVGVFLMCVGEEVGKSGQIKAR